MKEDNKLLLAMKKEELEYVEKGKILIKKASALMRNLPPFCEVSIHKNVQGELTFEFLRIVQDEAYFSLTIYQRTPLLTITEMMALLNKAIRSKDYPNRSFYPSDFFRYDN